MIELGKKVYAWFDDRLKLTRLHEHTSGHPIPGNSASWFYVFGSATLLCFVIQVLTGTLLAFSYVPSAAEAYSTLQFLTFEAPLGWYLRAIHYWGSNIMCAMMLIHMTQVYLFGAYKYPRELTWVTGVLLLLCTLGAAFTGQVMRFDEDAYWGLGIGAAIAGRTPVIGEQVVTLMLGGPILASETLGRFFSVHVFVIPGAIIALVSVHLRLVLLKGINEYPKPGRVVRRETYDREYDEVIKKTGIPFFPNGIGKDLIFSAFTIILILFCAAVFGPKGPLGPPDPVEIDTLPRPDFYFLWIFAVAALMPVWLEDFGLLVAPVLGILFLIALPFFNGTGEKSWRRRPVAVLSVIFIWLSMALFTWLGYTSPWSPAMNAWTGDPIPEQFLKGRTPLELQGALVLQNKQCRNCHAIDGIGGQRGPDLADVGARLTKDQLIRQVIQGGGNMPAYGKNLSPQEVAALAAYMVTLRPETINPARDSTFPAKPPEVSKEKKKEHAAVHAGSLADPS
ncbi:MAG TPA: cytochrome b N-terminal domain-containing protein [Chthoniobacterales bacterium]